MRIWPEYIELNYFFAQLVEEYPDETLPLLFDDKEWPDVAAIIAAKPIFAKVNVPSPFSIKNGAKENNFATWQEWAKAAYICVNSASPNLKNE